MESRLTALAGRYNAIEKSLANLTAALGGAAPAAAAPRPARQVAPPPADTRDTEEVTRLKRWVHEHGLTSATFHWVPSEYYQQNLQWRRDILGAPSSQHLCKTIVLENTHCIHDDCSDPNNSRFYMIVFQYVERFDAEMVSRVLREKNPGVGKKKFNLRLADPDKALQLTGFSDGAVAPFGTPVPVPVILSSSVTKLSPPTIFLGGGHVDCKCCVEVEELIQVTNAIVAPVTVPLSAEELETIMD